MLSESIDQSKCFEEYKRSRAVSPQEKNFDDVWLGREVQSPRAFRVARASSRRGASQPRKMSQKGVNLDFSRYEQKPKEEVSRIAEHL